MTKSVSKSHKTLLGFAGVMIVIAIVAAVLAGRFVPTPEPEVADVVEAPEPEKAAPAAPVATTWADEGDNGGFADDWNEAAVASAAPDETLGSQGGARSASSPTFGEFAPTDGSRSASSSRRSGSGRSGSSSGPRIETSTAPGAPPLNPPGGPSEPLQQAE